MSNIPVSELFLFNHGMGYLVRKGAYLFPTTLTTEVQQIVFKIKSGEINDILKSLLLQFPNCTVTDINYTTPTLEETSFELSEENTLSSFIERNKGVLVSIEIENSKELLEGRLFLVQDEKEETREPKSLSLLTGSGIKSIAMRDIKNLHVKDEKLVKELQKALFNYTWDKDKEREIIISFKPQKGMKSTIVSIGYLIQMPIWKVSYRLRILSDNEIRISGWTIIENETSDDWNQINLKLISGNPISFIYDQDSQAYLSRSDFTPEPPKASGPVIAQASLESEGSAPSPRGEVQVRHMMALKSMSAPAGAPPPSPNPMMKSMMVGAAEPELDFDKEEMDDYLADAIDAVQETEKEMKTGSDYYVFDIKSQITIPAKEKSLIPLINETVDAEQVLYHKNTIVNPSPYQAIELANNTEFPFEQGPVMVFSDLRPIGQAILEKLQVGESRILTYALEDRIRLQYKSETTSYSEFRYTFQPEKRILIQRRFKYVSFEIRIINFLDVEKKLIIDYYPDEEIDLLEESIPTGLSVAKKEKYFRIQLIPKEKSLEKHAISFKKELLTTINFESLNKQIILNIPSEDMNDKTKENILLFIDYQDKYNQILKELNNLKKKMEANIQDENRIQKNIMSLSPRKEDDRARNNFITKLEEIFDGYLEYQKKKEELLKQQVEIKNNLDNQIEKMNN